MAGGTLTRILAGTNSGLLDVTGDARELEGQPVTAIAAEDGVLWALATDDTLWRARDGTWQQRGKVLNVRARCLLPDGDGVLVGTSEARLLQLEGNELRAIDAFDAAPGRSTWHTPWGGPPDTRSLSRGADGTVYANVHVGGILRARPGWASWEPTIEVDADVHQVLADPVRPGVVFAACAYGLATSVDGGDTWRIEDEGLHGSYCRALAIAGDTIVVTASTGPFTRRAAVYRRPLDGAGAFERCTEGLPEWFGANVDTYCLAARDDLVALAAEDRSVYRSDDGGRTWDRIAQDLPPVHALLVGD